MHVSGISLDLSWFLQFIITLFLIALGLLHVVKNTASKYFVVDDTFDRPPFDNHTPSLRKMPGRPAATPDSCAVCGNFTTKNCAGCKTVRYCSADCQRSHWTSGHKQKCKELRLSGKVNSMQPITLHCGSDGSEAGPSIGNTNIVKHPKEKILFPYEEFVDLFNWKGPGFPPCGLLNCGNSCFANVVLQCLSHTRPLVAYLLEKGHRGECRKNGWCFLCELQSHVERSCDRRHPFSPLNILSRLPNIGGNLGYGKQEDAHEFMRFAIDTMQSVCLDEFGGERALHPCTQETTLIQHIFGGHLESQVICTKCNNISKQYENMMDLTVEIHGDAGSLEECLDQFTVREQLHGDNMYKCDGCNDYVMAWKRLTIRRAPNILTIALKRFQSGRFGKLNKRVTFPETLDLSPYMSEAGHEDDIYKLYAVVVHVDMLNASYFGHYICYIKDFCGKWYRIDDCKVTGADLEEVLSQGAYMLLYSRVSARPSCLKPIEEPKTDEVVEEEPSAEQSAECSTMNSSEEQETGEVVEEEPSVKKSAEYSTVTPSVASFLVSGSLTSDSNSSEEQKTDEVVEEEPSVEQSAQCSTMTPSVASSLVSGPLTSDSNSSEEQKTDEVVEEELSAEQSAECSTMTPSVVSFLGSGSLASDSNSSEEQKTAEVVEEGLSAECSILATSVTSKPFSDGSCSEVELSSTSHPEEFEKDSIMVDSAPMDIEVSGNGHMNVAVESSLVVHGVLPEASSNGSSICESTIPSTNGAASSGKEVAVSHIENHLPLVGARPTSEISMPVQNGTCQNIEISSQDSSANSNVILDDVNLAVSSCKPKMAVKSSCRAKSKPLFARGFLEKPPRRKCLKTDSKSPSEKGQHAASSSNGKPGLISQNGSLMKQPVGNCLVNGDSGDLASRDEDGLENMETDSHPPPIEQSIKINGDFGALASRNDDEDGLDDMEIDGHSPIEQSIQIAPDSE